jgi:hypothetical protein
VKLLKSVLISFLFSTSFSALAQDTKLDYKKANEELVNDFSQKESPVNIRGLYIAKYKRTDGSGEEGNLSAYFASDVGKLYFVAELDVADVNRWNEPSKVMFMSGDYYFQGSALKVKNAIGNKELIEGNGAAVEQISSNHFVVYYYDINGLPQSLHYIKDNRPH